MADPNAPREPVKIAHDELVRQLAARIEAGKAAEVLAFAAANKAAVDSSPAIASVVADAATAAGRLDEAEALLRQVLAQAPRHAPTLSKLSLLLLRRDALDEAQSVSRRLLDEQPDLFMARHNLAFALLKLGRFSEAEAQARQVLAQQPAYARSTYTLGLALLSQGRFEEGLEAFEARLDPVNAGNNSPPAPVSYPHWRGEPLDGKSILIWIEQGLGDEIMMARYAAVLKARGASLVSLFCRPALEPLFKSLPGVDAVYPTAGSISLPQHDYWVYPMSLPRLCGARSDATAWSGAYLTPSDEARGQWSDPKPKRFAVGLVWSGKAAHVNDAHRSLPSVRTLAPLWSVSEAEFYSLQKDRRPGDDPAGDQPMADLGPRLSDFEQTAAAIERLDLVITVDTAVAHLAGAMGKRAFVLLPSIGQDWRWLTGRADSPWYPSLTLFRQQAADDWAPVIEEMKRALSDLVREDAATRL